ncbi:protein of unknown function [Streptomyces sp. KY70]|nr:protein of unknown function [Streptomyces sp. KY70]
MRYGCGSAVRFGVVRCRHSTVPVWSVSYSRTRDRGTPGGPVPARHGGAELEFCRSPPMGSRQPAEPVQLPE